MSRHRKSIRLPPNLAAFISGSCFGIAILETCRTFLKDLQKEQSPRDQGSVPAQLAAFTHANGIPSQTQSILPRSDHLVCFCSRTRNPLWTLERVSNKGTPVVSRKEFHFKEDTSLEPRFRSRLKDFKGSGFDRGHLIAAADHKDDAQGMADTFLLSNVSPQFPSFNRGLWRILELFARDLAVSGPFEDVYVITGPLFLPTPLNKPKSITSSAPSLLIGNGNNNHDVTESGRAVQWEMRYSLLGDPPALLSVPTHFFKIIIGVSDRSFPQANAVAAFVLPNSSSPAKAESLKNYLVPLESLEAASGISFFPELERSSSGRRDQIHAGQSGTYDLCTKVKCDVVLTDFHDSVRK